MNEPGNLACVLAKAGSDWRIDECFAVKEWFAREYASRALHTAAVKLASDVRLTHPSFAEQAVQEWYEKRFDRMLRNFTPERGEFVGFAMTDLRTYITGTFAPRMRLQFERELPESMTEVGGGEKISIYELTAGEDGRERVEWIDLLEQVIRRLEPGDRALLLRIANGETYEQVADSAGITPGHARVQVFRARARARQVLAGLEEVGREVPRSACP